MKYSLYLLITFYLLFLRCSHNNDNSSLHSSYEFNLISNKNLINVYNYIGCNNRNTNTDEMFFLEIRSKSQDTIFAMTYRNGKSIFIICPCSIIRKYEEEYLYEGGEPFYPPSSIDTILPYQNKIYPFFMPLPQNLENSLYLLEPRVFIKNMKPNQINFPKKLKGIKHPFIVYRLYNENFIDYTTEFISLFDKK